MECFKQYYAFFVKKKKHHLIKRVNPPDTGTLCTKDHKEKIPFQGAKRLKAINEKEVKSLIRLCHT